MNSLLGRVIRPARSDDRAALLDVILSANPTLGRRIEHFRACREDWYNATPIVAYEGDQILSSAIVFRRSMWTGRGTTCFGGIGAVATRPEVRNQGLASAILEASEELLRSEGFRLAVLFCGIPAFYGRLGWRLVKESTWQVPRPGDDLRSITIRKIHIERDYPALSELYDRAATGAMVRPRQLWMEQLVWQREDSSLFLGAFVEDKLMAYSRARKDNARVEILEATAAPGFECALATLVDAQERMTGLASSTSSETQIVIKELSTRPDRQRSDAPQLTSQCFAHGTPWSPRIWWPIDRF